MLEAPLLDVLIRTELSPDLGAHANLMRQAGALLVHTGLQRRLYTPPSAAGPCECSPSKAGRWCSSTSTSTTTTASQSRVDCSPVSGVNGGDCPSGWHV